MRSWGLGRVFSPSPSDSDPPKSELKSARILGVALLPQNFEQDRGTLTKFSPLNKGRWGESKGLKTDSRSKRFSFYQPSSESACIQRRVPKN